MQAVASPFPETMDRDQRARAVRELGQSATQVTDEKLRAIQSLFDSYDSLYLLAFSALHFVAHPEGTDPEVDGTIKFFHHYIEILQGLALRRARTLALEPLGRDAQVLLDDMTTLGSALPFRSFSTLPDTDDESESRFVLDLMKGHNRC
jgi:hypothetical protein